MGMSGDFEAAIEMGSTNVRVGSTIFGAPGAYSLLRCCAAALLLSELTQRTPLLAGCVCVRRREGLLADEVRVAQHAVGALRRRAARGCWFTRVCCV